ncbi:hypothetical protein LZ190_20580, partial [Rhodovulum sulfidophilum]|nr:hypothetical protein [Rhodovulum sulfidophilum]
YELQGSYGVQLEQIGNSVPPRLAEVIARSVREQVFDQANELSHEPRPEGFKSTFRQRQRERSKRFKVVAQKAIEDKYSAKHAHARESKTSDVSTTYMVEYSTLFSRKVLANTSSPKGTGAKVEVVDAGPNIELTFDSLTNRKKIGSIEISISGLKKYLPDYNALRAHCNISSVVDIFHIWKEIEKVLTARSQFFTLIDIYGHYANRGDVVDINSRFDLKCTKTPVLKAVEYFSQTRNCGDFIREERLAQELNISTLSIPKLAEGFRRLRYDFRSSETHPIIGEGRYLCTYPFPLLSPRALVESRVEFIERASDQTVLKVV